MEQWPAEKKGCQIAKKKSEVSRDSLGACAPEWTQWRAKRGQGSATHTSRHGHPYQRQTLDGRLIKGKRATLILCGGLLPFFPYIIVFCAINVWPASSRPSARRLGQCRRVDQQRLRPMPSWRDYFFRMPKDTRLHCPGPPSSFGEKGPTQELDTKTSGERKDSFFK